jgi:hypothetical protein
MKTFVFQFKVKPEKQNSNYKTLKHGYVNLFVLANTIDEAENKARQRLENGQNGNDKWEIISDCLAAHECNSEHLLRDEINKQLYQKAQRLGVSLLISAVGFENNSLQDRSKN